MKCQGWNEPLVSTIWIQTTAPTSASFKALQIWPYNRLCSSKAKCVSSRQIYRALNYADVGKIPEQISKDLLLGQLKIININMKPKIKIFGGIPMELTPFKHKESILGGKQTTIDLADGAFFLFKYKMQQNKCTNDDTIFEKLRTDQ